MLKIVIPAGGRLWDEQSERFIRNSKERTLQLEHSLVAISKWESKWKTPFLSDKEKTTAMMIDYIRCMTVTQNVDPDVYYFLTQQHIDEVTKYINDPMTATWFSDAKQKGGTGEVITNEVIYSKMLEAGIPFECQKWHLNRLITLIRVHNERMNPKKMSKQEILQRQRDINKRRRAGLK